MVFIGTYGVVFVDCFFEWIIYLLVPILLFICVFFLCF